MTKIKLLYAWKHFQKGDLVDLNGTLAEALVRTGQAEIAKPMSDVLDKKRRSRAA